MCDPVFDHVWTLIFQTELEKRERDEEKFKKEVKENDKKGEEKENTAKYFCLRL